MAIRAFVDEAGIDWEVWEAHPNAEDRRRLADRRLIPRTTFERRIRAMIRRIIVPTAGNGWLVFRSSLGKWRVSPVPFDWELLGGAALIRLRRQAIRAKDL
jgi:hypothetical protein